MEFIKADKTDPNVWTCLCGNNGDDCGFFPCDEGGNEIEPTIESGWADLYICGKCGRIIKQGTLEVVGRNPHPTLLA